MKSTVRKYQTLKFFRGSERKNTELQRLSDEGLDFEYHRLLIEQNELDMHVAFSKMIIYKRLSWVFLATTFCFIQHPIGMFIFFGLAMLLQFFSFINKRFFQFVMRSHNIALAFVECVIFNKYGISFS